VKILLVQPPKPKRTIGGDEFHLLEPLSLEYVGAGVSEHHDVRLLDMRLDPDLDGALADFEPDVMAATAFTVHLRVVQDLCERVKGHNPEAVTVVGGHHATVAPDDLVSPHIDVLVIGEGVFVFREIVRRLERCEGLAGVPGTVVCVDGQTVRTAPEPIPDLDTFPLPARSLTAAHRKRYFSQWMKPLATLVSSKGCPFRCSFCALWRLTDGARLTRAPERLLDELSGIDEPYVLFVDYESLLDHERMRELARLIRGAGLGQRYCLYCRADTVTAHPDLLEAWREAGLESVVIGFEYFRDDDLAAANKGSSVADNEAAIRILHSLDINVSAYFIVNPAFSREDFAGLRAHCRGLGLRAASFFVLTPLPGTELYEEVKGELTTDDPALFDFFHTLLPTKLPLPDFYEERHRTYTGVLSVGGAVSLLKNFPLRELPGAVRRSSRLLKRIRDAHLDHR